LKAKFGIEKNTMNEGQEKISEIKKLVRNRFIEDIYRENWSAFRFGSEFINCHLAGCNFNDANLEKVNFTGSNLMHARLNEATLFEAILTDIKLNYASIKQANLIKSTLTGAYLIETKFKEAKLAAANMERTILMGTDFSGASLIKANFAGAQFYRSTNLCGADLRGANIEGDIKNIVRYDTQTRWPEDLEDLEGLEEDLENLILAGDVRRKRQIDKFCPMAGSDHLV
jgi:uncharacterized protein YjbI with pentapeptide repeats